jgi:hypothetical protein
MPPRFVPSFHEFSKRDAVDLALFGTTTQRVIPFGYVPFWWGPGIVGETHGEIHPPNAIIDSSLESNLQEVFGRLVKAGNRGRRADSNQ